MQEVPNKTINHLRKPPTYCEYADGPCDQRFEDTVETDAVFLFPSQPEQIAATVSAAVAHLRGLNPGRTYRTWRDFQTAGQVVFCAICKSMRFGAAVVADVTTLNFNLLFEIGFALGLELPVIPIRDTTFLRDKRQFDELGIFDTIGYVDFQNADALAQAIATRLPCDAVPAPPTALNTEAPLYVLKGHIDTEGAVRLMSALKRSHLQFRTFDVLEKPRLALQEARKQVGMSLGVIAHLLSPERTGAVVHNARCAFVAGIAMATGKTVVLLQEGYVTHPIDYRDVVTSYRTPDQIPSLVQPLLLQTVSHLQTSHLRLIKRPGGLLEGLDIGDVAAENEVYALPSYFVHTAQFNEAKRGHARLVTGRKGSGKTAIFYGVRDSVTRIQSYHVIDLMPEGHQFAKFREIVLSHLTPGLQEHTLVAFWTHLLLCEIAQKAGDHDYRWAQYDRDRGDAFDSLMEVYGKLIEIEQGDFSERLLQQIDRLTERYTSAPDALAPGEITQVLFRDDIPALTNAVAKYLEYKDEVWVLVDNLDKGWPTRGATQEDIMILRGLLEATRKLQRQFQKRGVDVHVLVFLRNDIHDLLVEETPDRGKDTAITVDWNDPAALKELLRQRIVAGSSLSGDFQDVWPAVCDTHVGTQDSFGYMLDRTLMRPRDLLNFVHRTIEVAVNRGHERILANDILKAEESYSNDILQETSLEIRDVFRDVTDPLYVFLGCRATLTEGEVLSLLREAGFSEDDLERGVALFTWFGFLGVQEKGQEEPRFAYQERYNVAKLLTPIRLGRSVFVVHPAFRRALECQGI